MDVTLYHMNISPPCRTVLLTLYALGLSVNLQELDVINGQHLTPEYKAMNPQRTVPFMDDNGFYLSESRAIMEYLVDSYGENDDLLPKDLKLRAEVHRQLYFDATALTVDINNAYLLPAFHGRIYDDSFIAILDGTLAVFDDMIGDEKTFLVGEHLTIADIADAVAISSAEAVGHDLSPYKNIARWFENMKKQIPGYNKINQKGSDAMGGIYRNKKPM